MRNPPRELPAPRESRETARQALIALLAEGPLSARELSGRAGIPEREVCGHLRHIRMTIGKGKQRLLVTPAECRKCGFTFRKRERLERPGRCPACKGESISDPLFSAG
ncbi:MAG: transcriptional regulator [Deltaproteobacteria bacterium]|nr:transcriptional regulator [Deltaproteobacteria bacterium]